MVAMAALLAQLGSAVAQAQPRLGCAANGLTPAQGPDALNGYGTSLEATETWATIVGDPLIIMSGSRGSIAVFVCQPAPLGVTPQYYSEDAWASVVFLGGTSAACRMSTASIRAPPDRSRSTASSNCRRTSASSRSRK